MELGIMYQVFKYCMNLLNSGGAFFENSSLKNSVTSSGGKQGIPNKDFRNLAMGPFPELYIFWKPISLNLRCQAWAIWNLQPLTVLLGKFFLKAFIHAGSKSKFMTLMDILLDTCNLRVLNIFL